MILHINFETNKLICNMNIDSKIGLKNVLYSFEKTHKFLVNRQQYQATILPRSQKHTKTLKTIDNLAFNPSCTCPFGNFSTRRGASFNPEALPLFRLPKTYESGRIFFLLFTVLCLCVIFCLRKRCRRDRRFYLFCPTFLYFFECCCSSVPYPLFIVCL